MFKNCHGRLTSARELLGVPDEPGNDLYEATRAQILGAVFEVWIVVP